MDVAMVSDVNIRDAVMWPRDQIVYKGRSLAVLGSICSMLRAVRRRDSSKRPACSARFKAEDYS